jgi:hypothetical protein
VFLLNRDSSCYQYPEKFSIERIIEDPERNIAMNLDFVANQGMSRTEAGEMNSKCISMAEEFFQSLHLWGTLPREHFLLYLDKFGKETLNGKQPPAEEEEQILCRA